MVHVLTGIYTTQHREFLVDYMYITFTGSTHLEDSVNLTWLTTGVCSQHCCIFTVEH